MSDQATGSSSLARLRAFLRPHWPAALGLLVLVCAALWPLPRLLLTATDAVGQEVGDLADHYWGTWWFGGELLRGRLPGATDLVQYPGEVRLWYVDPLGALVGLLLRPLGYPGAYNAMVLVQAMFAALAAYAVGVWASGSRAAGFVAGAVAGASPYMLGLVHSGLSEYFGLGFPVLFTGALISAMGLDPRGRPPMRGAPWIAGALLAACAAQAFYYVAFGGLLTICAVVGPGWRGRVRTAAQIAVVSGVLAAPLFIAAWLTLSSPDAAVTQENAPGWAYKALPATDLLTFFRPGEYYFPDTRATNPGILHVNYLGWVALALAGLGLLRARAEASGVRLLGPMAATYLIFSLGPRLCVGGELLSWGAGAVPLPLALLYVPGSPFRFVHHPYRMVAFAIPVLAVLAAVGALALPRALRVAVGALIALEAMVVSPAAWPLASTPVEAPEAYAALPEGPILDWPPDATTWNRRYLLWQVTHRHPIAYGVNTFLPDEVLHDPLVQRLLRELMSPDLRARNRDVAPSGRVLVNARGGTSRLHEMGYRLVALHTKAVTIGELDRATSILNAQYGQVFLNQDTMMVWKTR